MSLKNNENFILVNKSNKNDVIKILGEPSTKSNFDNNVWFYIEQKKQNKSIVKLGKQYIEENNVLTIYFDNKGIVSKKKFLDKNDLNQIEFAKKETKPIYNNNSFMYEFLTSFRDKVNAPFKKKDK
jgi:outer membrane protein assembly factor BamE (lipoprotein component of BamABCDE complex)